MSFITGLLQRVKTKFLQVSVIDSYGKCFMVDTKEVLIDKTHHGLSPISLFLSLFNLFFPNEGDKREVT